MNKKILFSVFVTFVIFVVLILVVVISSVKSTSNKQTSNNTINSVNPDTAKHNIVLIENIVYGSNIAKKYTLSNEDSTFLYDLVTNMTYRNYNCDGLAKYIFSIDDSNYGIEIYESEIHIVPTNNTPNEGIITGQDYQTLKQILDKYTQN